MAEIALEIRPLPKEIINPKPKKKNLIHRLILAVLKLTVTVFAVVKHYLLTKADGEKVLPLTEENPAGESGAKPVKPKKGRGRLKLILKIIAGFIVVVGVVNFFLWVVINPRKMKFYVTDAKLTEFSLGDVDNTLRYSLQLNFTVRNPNKRVGLRYVSIEGGTYYGGEKFDSGNLVTFYQPPKTTSSVHTWFSGVKRLSLGRDEVEAFNEQRSSGVYPIDVKIRVYSSIKLGKIRMGDFKVKIKCGLKVPLLIGSSNGGESLGLSSNVAGFKATQCLVDFNPLIVMYSD